MKERDLRPRTVQDRYLELCAQDAATLLAEAAQFTPVACPACGATASEPAFIKQGYHYHTCAVCHSLYLHLRPTPAQLAQVNNHGVSATFWAEEFYPQVVEKRRIPVYGKRATYARQLAAAYQTEFRHLMDIGAGCGVYAEELRKVLPEASISVLEPAPRFAADCRQKGFTTYECLLDELPATVAPVCLCTSFEVLEHLHAPADFLRGIARILRPGGVVLLTSLCCDGFDIQTMWEQHRNVYPPHHINILSLDGYRRLFAAAGFTDIRITTPGTLDVDIVRSQLPEAQWPRFLRTLFRRGDETVVRELQTFLADNQLSSHCWVTARRA
jgi:SAM-dependent methyltransferase